MSAIFKYVYVAGPYTKGDVAMNVRTAICVGDMLRGAGYVPFIPHLTHFWHMVEPHPIEFWYAYDMEWLERCDCVVRLAGESSGADKEVARAKELDIPVYFSPLPDLFSMNHFYTWEAPYGAP